MAGEAPNGLRERVQQHGEEIHLLRVRAHEYGNELLIMQGKLNAALEDLHELKGDVHSFRGDFARSREGMTTAEKIALGGVAISIVLAVLGALALFAGAPS